MTVQVKGAAEVMAKLAALEKSAPREFGRALEQEAQAVMTLSKQQCPVDHGRLRNSGFVSAPEMSNGHVTIRLGYGTTYALAVHERTWVHHPSGKAKFLTDPLNARMAGFRERMLKHIDQALQAGAK